MSEAALNAARVGLDHASALGIGQTSIDATTFAYRTDGLVTIGGRAELVHRFTSMFSAGANGFAEKDIGGQSRLGGGLFGRWSF